MAETELPSFHQSAQQLSALPLKPGAPRRGKDRKQAKFCHPKSVASKFSFPWLFTRAHTPVALPPKLQLQDLCPFSCSHFSHLPVGKEHLLQILVCSHSGKNFPRPHSDLPLPLLGLFLPKTGKVSPTINESYTWRYLSLLQNSDFTPYRVGTEDSLPFAWELAEV